MEGSCREGGQAPTAGTPDRAAHCESKERCPAPAATETTACNAPNNDRHTPAREGMDNANMSANSDSQKEPSVTEDHEPQDLPSVRNLEESGASSKDGHDNSPAFVTARSVLARNLKEAFLSPRFRSVVAMAGWDDESLLMASQADDTCLDTNTDAEEGPRLTSVRSPGALEQSPQGVVLDSKKIRDRKREVRTPQQAITPLSAGRRHRRPRRQAIHGCPAEVLPIGDLSLNQEFQTGIVSERDDANEHATGQADGSSQGEAAPSDNLGDAATESKSSVAETPTCFDQLREELSCAVCLDICFEPSTTSCGHSFCRGCLRSVLQRCGPRCPKCRQQLKGDAWRSCPVNTVLWNTVQILFPGEVRDRAAASRQEEEEAEAEKQRRRRSQEEEGNARGASRVAWQSARVRAAGLRRTRARASSAVAPVVEVAEERPPRRTGSARVVQEQVDAALARRLQRAELMNSRASSALSMASAAANLRAVAYSAVRGHRHFL